MANEKKPVKIHRVQIAMNVLLQLALVAMLLVLANSFAFKYYRRWDFSRNEKYALSSQTRQLLKSLRKPLKIIIFFSGDVMVGRDVAALLKEYQYASQKKIEIETVNPYRDFTRAKELQARYKFGSSENLLILDYKERTKFVNAADMADYDMTGAALGQPPQVKAFKGEQVLTSALIELTEDKQGRVCVLEGHGEPDLTGNELTSMRTYLERQNLKVEPLSLSGTGVFPADASALMILGPKYDLSEREMALVRAVWARKGRLFIALDPAGKVPRLRAFLEEAGISPQDDRVLTTVNLGPVTGVVRDVNATFAEGNKFMKRLKGVNTMFLGNTQSLKLDIKKDGLRVQSLLEAADGFWGETAYGVDIKAGGLVIFEPKTDHAAPLVLAASAESGAVGDPRVDVGGGRVVVVGNADFLNSEALTQVEPNVDLLVASMNWLLDREELSGVAPKAVRNHSLNLTEKQVARLALFTIVIIPFAVGLLGMVARFRRLR